MDNKNSGLMTKIWGPHFWVVLHCVAYGFPTEPTSETRQNYLAFYRTISNVLPCKYCRDSYSTFIVTSPTILCDDVVENRETLVKWVYNIHERVNNKLGVKYNVTYEEIDDIYESFRAKCIPGQKSCAMPLDLKSQSYIKAATIEAPVISIDIAKSFKEYAEKRGVKFHLDFFNELFVNKGDKWQDRNKACKKIIDNMRKGAIPSIEESGEHKGLPTIEELKLISMLCSTLCEEELNTLILQYHGLLQ